MEECGFRAQWDSRDEGLVEAVAVSMASVTKIGFAFWRFSPFPCG